ncbi:MAG: hypothetical protein HZC40_13445 [Chloroflexi bacterium]|nr:hypothetical protein [Chloroflexota bacterium]
MPPAQSRATPASAAPILTQVYDLIRTILTRLGVAPSSIPATAPSAGSIRESLARLGITFSRGQIIGFVVSLIGGMIVARILPFIYPVFDPILTFFFGRGPSPMRDGFNTNAMTLITFSVSFVLSFATMFLTRSRAR